MESLRIFMVDADRDFAESVAEVLESRVYSVETANGAQGAVQAASRPGIPVGETEHAAGL